MPDLIVRVAANLAELKANLAEGKSQIETTTAAMGKLAASFSGDKLMQAAHNVTAAVQAIGGAGKLTEAEMARVNSTLERALEKYRVLGKEAPVGMQQLADATKGATTAGEGWSTWLGKANSLLGLFGLGLSAAAVVNFGKSLLESAGNLVAISAKTGLFIDDIQRLEYVASQTGGTLDTLTGAIGKMQLNLNDPKAQQAFRDLNINFADLRAANPYQQFEMIAEAVGRVESPVQQAEMAVAIFGKTGAEILPQLKSHFADLASGATTSGEAQTRAVAQAGDAIDREWKRLKNQSIETVGGVALVGEKFGWLSTIMTATSSLGPLIFPFMFKAAKEAAAAVEEVGEEFPPVIDAQEEYRKHLDTVSDAVDDLTSAEKDTIREAIALGESTADIAGGMNLTTGAVEVYTAALRTAAEAEKKKAADAKKAAEVEASAVLATTKLWDEYFALKVSHGGTANDIAIAQIDKWAADLTAQMIKAKTDTKEFYEGLAALSKEKMAGVGIDWAFLRANSRETLQETAANARATYQEMISGSQHFSREVMEEQLAKVRQAEDAARGMGGAYAAAFDLAAEKALKLAEATRKAAEEAAKAKAANMAMGNTLDVAHAAQDPRIMQLLHDGWSLENATKIKLAENWGFTPKLYDALGNLENAPSKGERVPGYQFGGVGDFGSGTLAMLHGREAIIPLGPSGDGVGSSAGGGVTVHVTNYITQPLGTPSQIAAAMDAAVMKSMRDRGVRF